MNSISLQKHLSLIIPFLLISTSFGDLLIHVSLANYAPLRSYIKSSPLTKFAVLSNVTAVDHVERKSRFSIITTLLSPSNSTRVSIMVSVPNGFSVPSISSLYKSASFWEREVWDMFGIPFIGHPDCRRLLSDYGFRGHALRKDFPVTGYFDVIYSEIRKRVISVAVSLAQEIRVFNFERTW